MKTMKSVKETMKVGAKQTANGAVEVGHGIFKMTAKPVAIVGKSAIHGANDTLEKVKDKFFRNAKSVDADSIDPELLIHAEWNVEMN